MSLQSNGERHAGNRYISSQRVNRLSRKIKVIKGYRGIEEVAILNMAVEEVLADKRFGEVREICQCMGEGRQ